MTLKYSILCRSIALLLVVTLGHVYVLASPGSVLLGRLATSGNSIISVNGNIATSGTTILSGAQLQTPVNSAATVRLDSGSLEILPGSNLTLTFNEGNVAVNVAVGGAVLTTKKGINGSVIFNGVTTRTDPSAEMSTVTAGTALPNQGNMSGAKKGAILGSIVGAIIIIAILLNRGDNDSPSSP